MCVSLPDSTQVLAPFTPMRISGVSVPTLIVSAFAWPLLTLRRALHNKDLVVASTPHLDSWESLRRL